ncbi:MAG TPA: ribonuclease Z [Gemmatimonadaceae bacterium]|nr:ribonuclease Z [Gemmatimonadaceae bacterium]
MSLAIRFLGTSASRPTVERNVSSIALIREGETILFDCGEGTQRQMMRYGITFALDDIFFTHLHADHILGVIGLCRTMALQGRTDAMRLYGPRGCEKVLRRALALGNDREEFPVTISECVPGEPLKRGAYSIVPFAVQHAGPSLGYALIEDDRLGRFNPDRARELGVPEGRMWGELHRGRAVQLEDGRTVTPEDLVGPPRPGRRIVITGDCLPSASTVEMAHGADLLVHEATFGEEESARAAETGHSTAKQAAEVASRAGVRQLALTHLSARYSREAVELEREARAVFPATVVARDGMTIEIAFRDAADDPRPG